MKYKIEQDTTTNSTVYNRARKRTLENTAKLHCSICKYHRGENRSKPDTSWKRYRKKQYRVVDI